MCLDCKGRRNRTHRVLLNIGQASPVLTIAAQAAILLLPTTAAGHQPSQAVVEEQVDVEVLPPMVAYF